MTKQSDRLRKIRAHINTAARNNEMVIARLKENKETYKRLRTIRREWRWLKNEIQTLCHASMSRIHKEHGIIPSKFLTDYELLEPSGFAPVCVFDLNSPWKLEALLKTNEPDERQEEFERKQYLEAKQHILDTEKEVDVLRAFVKNKYDRMYATERLADEDYDFRAISTKYWSPKLQAFMKLKQSAATSGKKKIVAKS